ncbi:peptide chain release factor N(5)-glutamine methyltransferase [Alkalicoccus daliensis]|uniref:Release factor glutamine methyltransferase n=1 Tax=Alkalicoccus daliensis TaxID=745820 RepID=A0A1H0KE28_9BACI|nr:peptide chain release factor N(5)-glutamine methyltransferase [Alkalicoccus daliensis]SDO54214.1 release factor glutamine methyltransferase [Alkalicoccus daliensis]
MQKEMYVHEALAWASSFLEKAEYEKEIGYILLGYHTGWNRSRLLAELRTMLTPEVLEMFQKDVAAAAGGVPVQHITGREIFYGRSFAVNSSVLIPRPETEELIEAVLEKVPAGKIRIADIGTGSGIIAATLALEIAEAEVTATDISPEALVTAEKNAAALGARVTFHEGDALAPLLGKPPFHVIVSNPPYIPEAEKADMNINVTEHEPENALFAGEDGLTIYKRITAQLPEVIHSPGLIAFEIGHGQGKAVQELIKNNFPQAVTELRLDINRKERIVIAEV